MNQRMCAVAAAAIAIGLAASACGGSSNSGSSTTSHTASGTAADGGGQLQSLIPTPEQTQRTDGPDFIADSGIHLHFFVNGSPTDVMNAYKTALEGKGWSVTVVSSGGGAGGGGATYTATHGATYGVFTGGGSASTTDVGACAWPSKPANPNCGGNR